MPRTKRLTLRNQWHAGRELVREVASSARVIAVPQFNATVVNTHLSIHSHRASELEVSLGTTQLGKWTEKLQGFKAGYAYRYYAALETSIKTVECPFSVTRGRHCGMNHAGIAGDSGVSWVRRRENAEIRCHHRDRRAR